MTPFSEFVVKNTIVLESNRGGVEWAIIKDKLWTTK